MPNWSDVRGRGRTSAQNLAPSDKDRVAKDALALAGFGNRETARQARAVVEAAEREPAKYGRLVEDMDRSGRVGGVYRRLVVAQKAAAIAAEPPPLPTGPFRTIVADPPWFYARDDDPSHRGACPYPTMTVPEICAMPVAELAAEDAILWLWTTNAQFSRQPIRSSTRGGLKSAPS